MKLTPWFGSCKVKCDIIIEYLIDIRPEIGPDSNSHSDWWNGLATRSSQFPLHNTNKRPSAVSHQSPSIPFVFSLLHSLYKSSMRYLQPSLLVALLSSTFSWLVHSFNHHHHYPCAFVFTFFAEVKHTSNSPVLLREHMSILS